MSPDKSEELELLALVHADLDSNGPRLMYADWLQNRGRAEEAELIRLQCDPQAEPRRLANLLAKWEPRWRAGLEFLSPPGRLDRGFLRVGPTFYLHNERSDELSQRVEAMLDNRALYACERLHLGYSTGLTPGLTRRLAKAPYASRIAHLVLNEVRLAEGDLVELLDLPALHTLELHGGISSDWGGAEYLFPSVSDKELDDLAASPWISRLKTLVLFHQSLTPAQGSELRARLPEHVLLTIDGKRP